MKARLLELLLGQIIALAPLGIVWWYGYLDADDREAYIERARSRIGRLFGLDVLEWMRSPRLAMVMQLRGDYMAEEFAADHGNRPDLAAFIAGLDADIDELEAEGIQA